MKAMRELFKGCIFNIGLVGLLVVLFGTVPVMRPIGLMVFIMLCVVPLLANKKAQ